MKSGLFVPNAPSLRRNGVAGCVLLLLAVSGVQAVEERLEQGPDEASFRFGLASQQVDDGRLVNDDLTLFGSFDGRANYVGFHLDAWMAIDDNSFGTVDSAELTEIRARIDYLIDVPDLIQIIPHVQSSIYPHVGRAADEPVWVGIDAWYMAPWEGVEFGASIDVDAHEEEHGWFGSLGSRQFYQNRQAAIDIATWETLNFGNHAYHRFTSGADEAGLTTLEIGGELTLPMLWEGSWAFIRAESYWWLMQDDREANRDSVEFVLSVGAQYDF